MELSWIQRHILLSLLRVESARLKDLTPEDMPANQFSYHLTGLVKDGLIEKSARGTYALTTAGQRAVGTISTSTNGVVKDVKTVIMFYAKQGDQYLLFRWSRQPYINRATLLYDRIAFDIGLGEAVIKAEQDKLGQVTPLFYKTTTLVKIFHDDTLVSSMSALVFEVDLSGIQLPFQSLNGTAFLGTLDEGGAMEGLGALVAAIESGAPVSEATLIY